MSYINDPNDDENQGAQAQLPGQVSGQPNAVSGQSSTQSQNQNQSTEAPAAPTLASDSGIVAPSAGSPGASAPEPKSSEPTHSGQWTNLQNYLNVNNGGQFGKDFSGKVGSDVSGAQDTLSNAASSYAQQVDQGTVKNNPDVLAQLQIPTQTAPVANGTIGIGTSPTSNFGGLSGMSITGGGPTSMSDADKAAFKTQLNGSYSGPQNATSDRGFQGAYGQAQNAFGEAQAAQSPGGQQALLQKFYQSPNYSQGAQGLDAAILGGDKDAQAALQSLYQNASTLPVAYRSAAQKANAQAAQGAGDSSTAQQAAAQALYGTGSSHAPVGGALGNFQTTLTNQFNNDTTTRNSAWSKLQADLASGKVTQEDLALLGSSAPALGSQNYGVNPLDQTYVSQAAAPTLSSSISPQQAAQLSALYDLAGASNSFIGDPTQVGTYDPSKAINFDSGKYNTSVQSAKQSYADNQAAIQKQIADNVKWLQKEGSLINSDYSGPTPNYVFDPYNPTRDVNGIPGGYSNVGAFNGYDITATPQYQAFLSEQKQLQDLNTKYNTHLGWNGPSTPNANPTKQVRR